jgi:hypothetical protein
LSTVAACFCPQQLKKAATTALRRPPHHLIQLRQRHSTGPRPGDESKQNFALVVTRSSRPFRHHERAKH